MYQKPPGEIWEKWERRLRGGLKNVRLYGWAKGKGLRRGNLGYGKIQVRNEGRGVEEAIYISVTACNKIHPDLLCYKALDSA